MFYFYTFTITAINGDKLIGTQKFNDSGFHVHFDCVKDIVKKSVIFKDSVIDSLNRRYKKVSFVINYTIFSHYKNAVQVIEQHSRIDKEELY